MNKDKVEDYLKGIVEKMESMPGDDDGQKALLADLVDLLDEAVAFEFHDFKNTKYPAPKMALASRLNEIRESVINGKYDN